MGFLHGRALTMAESMLSFMDLPIIIGTPCKQARFFLQLLFQPLPLKKKQVNAS